MASLNDPLIPNNKKNKNGRAFSILKKIYEKVFSISTITLLIMVISGATLMVAMRITLARNSYTYFVFQSGVLTYLPMVGIGIIIVCSNYIVNSYRIYCKNSVDLELRSWCNVFQFALMAILDGTEDLLQVFGASFTPLALQALLPQLVVPVTLLFSILWLKTKYTKWHYFGAIVILAGGVLAVYPNFFVKDNNNNNTLWGAILLASSSIPGAISALYKQKFLQNHIGDIWYMTTWVTFYQILWGFILCPLNSIKAWCDPPIPLNELPKNFAEGFLNTFSSFYIFTPWIIFISNVFIFNVCVLIILKKKSGDCSYLYLFSASFMYIITSIQLPIINLISTSRTIMGETASPLSLYDILALLLMFLGLIIYAWQIEKKRAKLEAEIGIEESERIARRRQKQAVFSRSGIVTDLATSLEGARTMFFIEPTIFRRKDPQGMRTQYLSSLGLNVSPHITPRSRR